MQPTRRHQAGNSMISIMAATTMVMRIIASFIASVILSWQSNHNPRVTGPAAGHARYRSMKSVISSSWVWPFLNFLMSWNTLSLMIFKFSLSSLVKKSLSLFGP